MMIKVLFGTESGNSEMAADDIAEYINSAGIEAEVVPMENYETADLASEEFVIVITSTYGEGELPETTAPFNNALQNNRPDLSKLKFAAFGLGDSNYDSYGNAIDIVTTTLLQLGANQIGITGKHDAARTEPLAQVSVSWATGIAELLKVETV